MINARVAYALTSRLTVYVDPRRGSDVHGDGSAEWPFRTPTKGMQRCPLNGTVLLAPGEYPKERRPRAAR